jgi:hypothetical protein
LPTLHPANYISDMNSASRPDTSPSVTAQAVMVTGIGLVLGLGLAGWAFLGEDIYTTLVLNALFWCT